MSDQIQRFLFDNTNVRGELVTLERAYAEVLDRHAYPPVVNRLLGELLAAVALLTDTVKLDGTLSIEVRGNGALSLLMAESNPDREEHTSELQSRPHLVCRLLLEKKNKNRPYSPR